MEVDWDSMEGGSGWRRAREEVDGDEVGIESKKSRWKRDNERVVEEAGCGWRQVSGRGRKPAILALFHSQSNTRVRTPRIPILWIEQSVVIGRTDDISFAFPPANTRYQIKFSVSEKLSGRAIFFLCLFCVNGVLSCLYVTCPECDVWM